MGEGITVPATIADALLLHARAAAPNEACALLAGEPGSGRVTTLHPARNAEASPYRFEVHPDDLVSILFAIERAGDELVAIFHSHVGSPPVPSASDRREARYPAAHLLAGLSDAHAGPMQALRAWRIEAGTAREVPLRID